MVLSQKTLISPRPGAGLCAIGPALHLEFRVESHVESHVSPVQIPV